MEIDAKIFEYNTHLELDENLTIINGDSGVGKTLLFNYFDRQRSYLKRNIYCFNAKYIDNISRLESKKTNIIEDKLKSIRGAIIVIDNADVVLDKKAREYIMFDAKNTYIIFGRNISGLWVTENNIASLVRDKQKKIMYLDYYFKGVNNK